MKKATKQKPTCTKHTFDEHGLCFDCNAPAPKTRAKKSKPEAQQELPLDQGDNKPMADVVELKSGKKVKLPKAKGVVSIGAVADMMYDATLRRKALEKSIEKEIEHLHEIESALKEYLINNIPKSLATGVAGKLCRVSVVTKEVPTVKDWDALQKYILKTKDFSLLGKSLSNPAIVERWDAGKEIPGVEHFNAVKLSINKL